MTHNLSRTYFLSTLSPRKICRGLRAASSYPCLGRRVSDNRQASQVHLCQGDWSACDDMTIKQFVFLMLITLQNLVQDKILRTSSRSNTSGCFNNAAASPTRFLSPPLRVFTLFLYIYSLGILSLSAILMPLYQYVYDNTVD